MSCEISKDGTKEFYPPDPLLGKSVALMGDIRAYAQNLAALVADDSAAKATTSVNATLGSVEKLANTLAEADGKPKGSVPSFATPVGAAVNWAVGEYAERVKLAGLRQATNAARPHYSPGERHLRQGNDLWFSVAAHPARDSIQGKTRRLSFQPRRPAKLD